ncbi:type IV secretion system protein, partial [Burkholderia cepacia]|uniref:type IV secretion system protein n=1 Tax=Burkholderia cepacia TaxID=292 RepID=UPI002ABD774B
MLRVYTGHEKADAWSFTRTILTVMCVFWALSWGGLAGTIYKAFVGFRDDTLRLLYDNKSMWQYVAEQNQAFVPMIVVLLKENFLTGGGMVIAGLFLQTVSTVLAAIVIFLRVTSDLGAGVVMLLLPLFVPFLFWEQTRGHLMHWFGAMLKFMLIGILLGISVKFNYDLIMPLVTSVTATHGAEAAYDNVSAALTIQGWSILFLGFGLRPL